MNNITGGLVRYKPGTAELKPYLAESWEVQDGGKVYIPSQEGSEVCRWKAWLCLPLSAWLTF